VRALAAAALLGTMLAAWPAAAHHVGAYTPRDNEITANFKQLKAALQARKLDLARRLFETGAVRREMGARGPVLPPGLEAATRQALEAGDVPGVERNLMVLFLALGRGLAREAERQVGDRALSREARVAAGQRFLEAIWRYYNLVDFAVSQHDSRASVAMRLAFDEAEGYLKAAPAPVGAAPAARSVPDPGRLIDPLRRIARILSDLIDRASPSTRRES
jgi:hypothetical protein